MKKLLGIFLILFLIFGITACKKDKNATLSLKDSSIELKVGETYTVNPTIAEAKDTTFTLDVSGESGIIEISGNTVIAKKVGEVSVTVALKSNSDVNATFKVKVVEDSSGGGNEGGPTDDPTLDVTGLATLEAGSTTQLTATFANITGTLSYRSSNDAVATVSNTGLVTAVAAGEVTIYVSIGGLTKEHHMTITGGSQQPTGTLTLTGDDYVFVSKTITLKVTKTNLEGSYTFTSSNESIATVTRGGIVKGIAAGNVTITVECGGLTATKEVEVKLLPTIAFTEAPDHILVDEKLDLKEYLTLKNVTQADLSYASSDSSVASVSENGVVTGLKDGTTKITVSYLTIKATLVLDVYGPRLTITNQPTQLNAEEDYQLTYTKEYTTADVVFSSSDESIATVSNTGLISPLKAGTVTITATCDTAKVTMRIQVLPGRIIITYDFAGGYSEELLVDKATASTPCIPINSYNMANGGFWTMYASDIFICDRDNWMNATFSDRIFIKKDTETGLYKVVGFTPANSATWPEGAEYVIIISNSYNGAHGGYNITIKPKTRNIQVGDYFAFDGDFKTCKTGVEVNAYLYPDPHVDGNLVVEYKEGLQLIQPGNLGYKFLGWYNGDTKVEDISSLTESIKLTAHWEELNPVTALDVTNAPDELLDTDTLQLVVNIVPGDAYFKTVLYSSSNTTIFEVSKDGLITAKNAGTATLTITDYLEKIVYTKEITIYPNKTIAIDFDSIYHGYLPSGQTLTVTPHAFGKGLDAATFTFTSSNESVATVDATGKITAVANGTSTITVAVAEDPTVNITFLFTVKEYGNDSEIDKLVKLLVDNNFGQVEYGNVSLYNDGVKRVYDSMYGSVNRYLFDDFIIHRDYEDDAVNKGTCHTTRRSTDQIEFVCVHDTATLTGTVVSIASGMANNTGNSASIHYTVGNDAIYSVVPETLIAWHAGDGTTTPFGWNNSGVTVTGDPTVAPKFGIVLDSGKYYLSINGTKSDIELPTGSITNDTYRRLTYLGPTWKVVNNRYYIGTIWYSKDYGYLSSHGGNNNSIGIEMCVNNSNDIYDTWQRTGQLVADILIRNDLDLTRVKMHNTFSGKNCPQCILSGGNWSMFMEFVAINYEIMTNYKNAKISIKSNNPDILDNTGRIYNPPLTTTTVSYDLTVEFGGETRTVTLYSVVAGTTTWEQWDGTYPASTIWNNGVYSLA